MAAILFLLLTLVAFINARTSVALTDTNYEAIIARSSVPFFINFCNFKTKPCRNIQPLWNELPDSLPMVQVAHVEIALAPKFSRKVSIIPTKKDGPHLVLIKGGNYYVLN